jgi:hypothetical protein
MNVAKTFSVSPNGMPYFAGLDILPTNKALVTTPSNVIEIDLATGKPTTWKLNIANATSVQRLRNGNTLIANQAQQKAVEYDNAGKSIKEYKPDAATTFRPVRAFKR